MKLTALLTLVLLLLTAQDSPSVAIIFPAPGDILSGQVTITGRTDVPGFSSSQLDFAYASNPTDTWFTLQTSTQPVVDAALAVWDTTRISDGGYVLRLRVFTEDGSFQEVLVSIKVQNDTPIPTPTPLFTSTPDRLDEGIPTPFLIAASPTPTSTPHPTPTPLPANPVTLNQPAVYASLGRGALVILGIFAFVGLLLRIRRY